MIFAVIGAALVKLAFFPDQTEAADPAFPSAEIVEPHYTVTTGTVRNDVSLTGTVSPEAAVVVPSTLTGEVREVSVKQGQTVKAGQELLKLRAEVFNSDGSPGGTDWDIVTAPVSGILSSFTALKGQTYSVGEEIGRVAPPSFNVSGSIPPEQLYRLTDRPTEAEVTINGGPAPFTCTGLTITSPISGESGVDGAEGTAGPTVKCAIPSDVTVFPGLAAEIVIAGGIAEDVLVVPITAVEGAAGTGNVHVVLPDGSTELRPVTLGLSDGVFVELTGGLAEGDVILEFVPGAPSLDEEMMGGECVTTPNGMICQG